MSVCNLTANIANSIVGFAVLTLPTGMERLSDNGMATSEALGVGVVLLLVFGTLNAWTFTLIAEACERTGTCSYTAAWQITLGPRTAWLVSSSTLLISFNNAVICQSIIGVCLTDLIGFFVETPEELPRLRIQLFVVVAVLLPLCLLPSLKPLSAASTFGLAGTATTAATMAARALDTSYGPEGKFFEVVQWVPTFEQRAADPEGEIAGLAAVAPSASSVAFFLSLASSAYLAHFNAPLMYAETRPDRHGSRLAPFRAAAAIAFSAAAALFISIGGAGFATFGEAVQALVINNYAAADPLAAIARCGLFLTVLFEFPLLERPFRLTLAEQLGSSSGGKGRIHVFLSLGAITAVAFAEPPLDQLAALGGATGGSLLIYIAPALITLRLASRRILPRSESGSFIIAADIAADTESEAPSDAAHGYRGPVAGAYAAVLWAMAAMGVVLAGAGSYSALQARDRPSDLQSGLDEADPETDTGEEEEGTPALEPPATKGVGGATASLAIAAPAATHSRRRAVRQMLICALPAGQSFPASVAAVWNGSDPTDRGVVALGGCAADYHHEHGRLSLVFALVRSQQLDFVRASPPPGRVLQSSYSEGPTRSPMGRKATLFHRPYFKHSAAWVDSVGLAITLEGRPCNLTFHEYAARADCALSPSHHDVIDEREHYQVGHRDVVLTNHHTLSTRRMTAVVRLVLQPATTLRVNNHTRDVVWAGSALFIPPCSRLVWRRLADWAAAWQAAGFVDIVVHARSQALCSELTERVPGVACVPSPSLPDGFPEGLGAPPSPSLTEPPAEPPAEVARDYLDWPLLNMVGLVQSEAAGYRTAAFLDVEDRPPEGAAIAAALGELVHSRSPYAYLFRPLHGCDTCPTSLGELAAAMRSDHCNLSGGLHKVLGVPARMSSVRVGSASPTIGRGHDSGACMQRPVSLIEKVQCGALPAARARNGSSAREERRKRTV